MKKTKEKILETALKLFNRYGLSKVTLRAIAQEMSISQGNLNYHFRKREDIIELLYFQLVSEIDSFFSNDVTTKTDININTLFMFLEHILNCFYDYRFFLLDFAEILRENPEIRKHYQEASAERQKMIINTFEAFQNEGIFCEESFEGEYLYLYKRIHILTDFWMSHVQISGQRITQKERKEYFKIIASSVFPYLTEKGRKEWEKTIIEGGIIL